jgi:hypothetical protein
LSIELAFNDNPAVLDQTSGKWFEIVGSLAAFLFLDEFQLAQ